MLTLTTAMVASMLDTFLDLKDKNGPPKKRPIFFLNLYKIIFLTFILQVFFYFRGGVGWEKGIILLVLCVPLIA